MNVKIGKHIKELRNRDGVTQDALAEALGVTGQAISKWENESGYPDIGYITPIANFFNVTIDQLFGHDRSESENKINVYCEKLDELHRNWADVNTRIDLARQALAEFPAEEKLLVRLATALWEKWSDDASDECILFVDGKTVYNFDKVRATEGWEEPAQIMEKLLTALGAEGKNVLVIGDGRSEISAGVKMGALCVSRLEKNDTFRRNLHTLLGTNILVESYLEEDFKSLMK